jgi:assimilatory nitrate reductase catalytic subunit
MAMHWGPEYLSGSSSTGDVLAGVNALTTSAFCPSSKQPELKHAAVKVLKAEMPWNLLGLAWLPSDQVLTAQQHLRALMPRFAFASCVPFSDNQPLVGSTPGVMAGDKAGNTGRTGVLFRAAAYDPASPELIAQIESALGLRRADTLRYSDPRKGQHRAARLVRQSADNGKNDGHGSKSEVLLEAVLLCGDTRAEAWIKTVLQDTLPAAAYGRMLLSPSAKAPVAVQSRGKVVCSCLNVTDLAIAQHLRDQSGLDNDAAMASLQATLRCGTNCGSCLPELKKAVREASAAGRSA